AVPDVELPCRVPFHLPRQFLQLDPENALPYRRARVIDRKRLSDDHRCLRREQTPVCLVDGSRDTVEAGREMNDRGLAETLVTLPAWRLRQGKMNLHVGAPVAETPRGLGDPGRNIHRIEQPPVELRRCDV